MKGIDQETKKYLFLEVLSMIGALLTFKIL